MRMLVKYTAYIDFDSNGDETDRSYYLSFVKKDDVMDIPFESLEDLKSKASKYTIAEYIKSKDFLEKASVYEDYKDFFEDVGVLVLYEDTISVKFFEN
ncbi:MAG: hypothetical protein QMB63_00085 [Clostridiaceae bacterium]